jgi:phage portal protein BeeE
MHGVVGLFTGKRMVDRAAAIGAEHGLTRDLEQVFASIVEEQGFTPADIRTLPAVAAAVRLLSTTVQQLPLTVTRGEVPGWLWNPRKYGSALDGSDMLAHTIDSMVIHGKAYILATCIADGDAPSWRLDCVDPSFVGVTVRNDGVVGRSFTLNGTPIAEVPALLGDARRMSGYLLHVPYRVTVAHPEGSTPLAEAAPTLRGHVVTERHASQMLESGTWTGGVLTADGELTQAQAQRYQDHWIESRKTGKIPVLGNGLGYRNEAPNAVDLQLVEARSFNQSVVWSLLGIPQSYMGSTMMGGQSSLNYANAQDNRRQFADNALRAITDPIEDALSQLLPFGRNRDEETRAVFDYDEWEGRAPDAEPELAAEPDDTL